MQHLISRYSEDVYHLVRDVELHQGAFHDVMYVAFVDQLRALANARDFAWNDEIEQALARWQTHRMFGDAYADPISDQTVLTSGIFDLPPLEKGKINPFPSREAVKAAIGEAMSVCETFGPCPSPVAEVPEGEWWRREGLFEMFLYFDIPAIGPPTAYPSIVTLKPLVQIDVGLMFSELVFDRDVGCHRAREAVKALCKYCELLAGIAEGPQGPPTT